MTRWGRRVVVVVTASCCLGAPAALGSLPLANAAFTATASNAGNTAGAATLAAPTGLNATKQCASGSAPTFVAKSSADLASAAVALAVPGTAQTGDLLIAHVVTDDSSTAASGWSLLHGVNGTGNFQSRIYQRIATSGDPGTTHSFTVTGTKAAGTLLAFRGAAGLADAGDAAGSDQDNTATLVAPSMTTTVANTLLVAFFGLKQGAVSFSVPGGMTEVSDFGGATLSLAEDAEARASTGATGTRTSTASDNNRAIAQSVLIEPGPTATVDLSWTATSSTWATGHEVKRGSTVIADTSPRAVVIYTDSSPGSGSVTYEVRASKGTWRSSAASTTLSVSCP